MSITEAFGNLGSGNYTKSYEKLVHARNYWVSDDEKKAIWFHPLSNHWKIGKATSLGSSTTGSYYIWYYSNFDALCPVDVNKWKLYDGENWVDAGSNAQVVCGE